jgi:hypothetical protein
MQRKKAPLNDGSGSPTMRQMTSQVCFCARLLSACCAAEEGGDDFVVNGGSEGREGEGDGARPPEDSQSDDAEVSGLMEAFNKRAANERDAGRASKVRAANTCPL